MPTLISTLLLAATPTATLTTNIHVPGSYRGDIDFNLLGSVVAVEGDTTTLALKYDDRAECSSLDSIHNPEETWTFHGKTGFEIFDSTAWDEYHMGPSTAHVQCNMPKSHLGSATCTYSNNGEFLVSVHCSKASLYATPFVQLYIETHTHTASGNFSQSTETVTQTSTNDLRSEYPEDFYKFCATGARGSTLPENVAIHSTTFDMFMVKRIQVAITAGEELLGATAGATPVDGGARATGTGDAEITRVCEATSSTYRMPLYTQPPSAAASVRAVGLVLLGMVVGVALFVW